MATPNRSNFFGRGVNSAEAHDPEQEPKVSVASIAGGVSSESRGSLNQNAGVGLSFSFEARYFLHREENAKQQVHTNEAAPAPSVDSNSSSPKGSAKRKREGGSDDEVSLSALVAAAIATSQKDKKDRQAAERDDPQDDRKKSPPVAAAAAAAAGAPPDKLQPDAEASLIRPEGQLARNPNMTEAEATLAAKREYNRRNAARARKRNRTLVNDLQQTVYKLAQDISQLKSSNARLSEQKERLTSENEALVRSQQALNEKSGSTLGPANNSAAQASAPQDARSPVSSQPQTTVLQQMQPQNPAANTALQQLLASLQQQPPPPPQHQANAAASPPLVPSALAVAVAKDSAPLQQTLQPRRTPPQLSLDALIAGLGAGDVAPSRPQVPQAASSVAQAEAAFRQAHVSPGVLQALQSQQTLQQPPPQQQQSPQAVNLETLVSISQLVDQLQHQQHQHQLLPQPAPPSPPSSNSANPNPKPPPNPPHDPWNGKRGGGGGSPF